MTNAQRTAGARSCMPAPSSGGAAPRMEVLPLQLFLLGWSEHMRSVRGSVRTRLYVAGADATGSVYGLRVPAPRCPHVPRLAAARPRPRACRPQAQRCLSAPLVRAGHAALICQHTAAAQLRCSLPLQQSSQCRTLTPHLPLPSLMCRDSWAPAAPGHLRLGVEVTVDLGVAFNPTQPVLMHLRAQPSPAL